MIPDETTEDWLATSHDRVFHRSEGDRWKRGEVELGAFLADHIPGWTVVITMGPYRGYDFRHTIHAQEKVIHLDCYSPAMISFGSKVAGRNQHPIAEHAESLLHDIVEGIKHSEADFDLTNE